MFTQRTGSRYTRVHWRELCTTREEFRSLLNFTLSNAPCDPLSRTHNSLIDCPAAGNLTGLSSEVRKGGGNLAQPARVCLESTISSHVPPPAPPRSPSQLCSQASEMPHPLCGTHPESPLSSERLQGWVAQPCRSACLPCSS